MEDWKLKAPRADSVDKEIEKLEADRTQAELNILDAQKTIEDAKDKIRIIDRMLSTLRDIETIPTPSPPKRPPIVVK